MKLAIKTGLTTGAMVGLWLFSFCGALESGGMLYFYNLMLKLTGHPVKGILGSTYDPRLILFGTLFYAAVGIVTGSLWGLIYFISLWIFKKRSLPKDEEGRRFLSSFVGAAMFLAFYAGDKKVVENPGLSSHPGFMKIPYPGRLFIYLALCYGLYRLLLFIGNKVLGLRFLNIFRSAKLYSISWAVLIVTATAFSFVPAAGKPARKPFIPEQAGSISGLKMSPNVIIIILDTLRADHSSAYGYERKTTQNLEKVASEGVLFENAFSSSPWTLPSHATLFTGLYPSEHGAHGEHFYLEDEASTLAEILASYGYTTAGFSTNPMVGSITNLDQGFSDFSEVWRKQGMGVLSLYKAVAGKMGFSPDEGAKRMNREVKRWIEKKWDGKTPFFLFMNFIEPHAPYNPPPPYNRMFLDGRPLPTVDIYGSKFLDYAMGGTEISDEEFSRLNAIYDGDVAYADFMMGEMLDWFEKKGLMKNSLLIILSDHGENIGDHRLIDHQLCLFDTLLKVPLVIRLPGVIDRGLRVKGMVETNMVFPTILSLLGIKTGATTPGEAGVTNLLDVGKIETAHQSSFAEYHRPNAIIEMLEFKVGKEKARAFDRSLRSLRTDEYKYIWSSDGKNELFDLLSDPGEEKNIIGEKPEIAREMQSVIDGKVASFGGVASSTGEFKPDDEAREKLKALGYIK